MNLIKIITIITLLIVSLDARKLEKVSLQLDWLHQFQFAGYYIAKEKGYYEEVNLDVNIKEFTFSTDLLKDVLESKSEYAVGKSSLIIDKLEGKEVVLLSAVYQNSPMVLISLEKSNINKPKDLKNKKVMLTPDARSAASINSMIISQGLQLSDIDFKPHSFKLEDLIDGTTDAMGCYLSNEPYQLDKKGIKYTIHNPSEYGFDFYGGLLFTSNNELNNNPSRVKRFHDASLKGWQYAFENIEETAQLIFDKFNTQNKTLDALIYEGKALRKLAKYDEGLLGNINPEKIDEIKRLYLLLSLSNDQIKSDLNGFIYNPNQIKLTEEEQKYLSDNTITLLSNNNYPPFTIIEDNKLTGMEIDYWKLINKKLKNTKYKIKIINNAGKSLKEIEKDPNLLKYSFSKKDNNTKFIKTVSINKISIGLITLNDKPFVSEISNLENKKIAIPKYSILYTVLKRKYPHIEYVETKNLEESLKLLEKGEVFGTIGKIPAMSYAITQKPYPNMKIAGTFDEKYDLKLIVNKDNKTLHTILNKAILSISEKEINEINSKYYSVIYHTTKDFTWIYKIILPLLIILIIIGFSNRKLNKEVKKRREIEEQLNIVANLDALTNIYNRRKIESLFNRELQRVKRYERELSIIFFDIDNFKLINDQLGHAIGDEVLIKLSAVVKNNIRETDFFGRWGGEEFIIILPETNKEQASNVAHLLKEKINISDFNIGRNVTCSFGVSQFEETDNADTLLTRADNAMYYVKRSGKNNVKVV